MVIFDGRSAGGCYGHRNIDLRLGGIDTPWNIANWWGHLFTKQETEALLAQVIHCGQA